MAIVALPAFSDNYIWTIVNEKNHTMICVDPGEASPVLTHLARNNLHLTHILVTHHHFDHAGGLEELQHKFPEVKIIGPQDQRIPLINSIARDEDVVHINHYDFRVLSIPGHTNTHIAYQEPSKNWLFCGDTLFSAGCGRVFDGTMESLFQSLQLLKRLPDQTQVYCAHEYTRQNLRFAAEIEPDNDTILSYANYLDHQNEYCSLPSTLALEKKLNPFLRTNCEPVKNYAKKAGINSENEFEIFRFLREKKDAFK